MSKLSGNHMVDEKGPFDKYDIVRCPSCESTDYRETRQCPECKELTDKLRCHECGEKTVPVNVCGECSKVWEVNFL